MKKLKVLLGIAIIIAATFFRINIAGSQSSPSDLVLSACPQMWNNLDVEVNPATNNYWNGSTSDRNDFIEYQRQFVIKTSIDSVSFDQNADDAITVASECVLRKNKAVDVYFGKVIDDTTKWTDRAAIITILLSELMD